VSELTGVKIVGAGLIGTSIGLGLRREQIPVWLEDNSSTNLRLAVEYGAGSEAIETEPDLVIVCLPPDKTAIQIAQELEIKQIAISALTRWLVANGAGR
jgi:prephenate dehydrogenase